MFTQAFIQAQIKENIKAPRHWPLCGELPVAGEFPAQMASNAENVSIWWRYHVNIHIVYNQAYMMFARWYKEAWHNPAWHPLTWLEWNISRSELIALGGYMFILFNFICESDHTPCSDRVCSNHCRHNKQRVSIESALIQHSEYNVLL